MTPEAKARQNIDALLVCLELVRLVFVRPYANRIVADVDRHLPIIRQVEGEIDTNLKCAQALQQSTLSKAFLSR